MLEESAFNASNYRASFLLEGLQEDAEEVAHQLSQIFHFDDSRVYIKTLDGPDGKDSVEYAFSSAFDSTEPVQLIDVVVNTKNGEQHTVNEFMNSRGYSLIRTKKTTISYFVDIYALHLVYAPTNPTSATAYVKEHDLIFHVTEL